MKAVRPALPLIMDFLIKGSDFAERLTIADEQRARVQAIIAPAGVKL